MKQKSTLLQNSTAKLWALLIALTVIVLLIISAGSTNAQTPTKSHITITEIEARKALRYKQDAEFFFQQSATKDSIVSVQDTIIAKQKKRIFARGMIITGEALIIAIFALKALK